MTIRTTILAGACLAAAVAVGCTSDKASSSSKPMSDGNSSGMSSGMNNGMNNGSNKPLEGNPGATTNQSAGYPQSDPGAYHPQTDDTNQYHPANPATVQPK